MFATIGANPKLLLSITGTVEALTGFLLLAAPSILVELLLGTPPGSAVGATVARVTGAALLALGVACWLGAPRRGRPRRERVGRRHAVYNVAVVAVLIIARASEGLSGIGFWPVALAHAGLAIWSFACLGVRAKS